MQSTFSLEGLADKTLTKEELIKKIQADPSLIPTLIEGASTSKAAVRYGCSTVLIALSEKQPDKLYPYWDSFVGLLDSKHRILTWNALAIIASLTKVDTQGKFDEIFDRYYDFLGSEYMVTVANTVTNSATIVSNKPYLADKIQAELLKVENLKTTSHLTAECKRVIAEKTIKTFSALIKYTQNKQALIAFAEKHQNSPRSSLKREAQNFLKKQQA